MALIADCRVLTRHDTPGVEGLPADGVLDLAALGLPALSMRVRVARNLKAFPLPAGTRIHTLTSPYTYRIVDRPPLDSIWSPYRHTTVYGE